MRTKKPRRLNSNRRCAVTTTTSDARVAVVGTERNNNNNTMTLLKFVEKKGVMIAKLLLLYLLIIFMISDMILDLFPAITDNDDNRLHGRRRHLSINLGDGDCIWTAAIEKDPDEDDVYGTLLAAFPGSGTRVMWQQIEGLTGIRVRDDFFELEIPKNGIVKTQYPHYEGIWSYADNVDQVILLIRNPRWAMPAYHDLINEIGYAHTWELSYEEIQNVFSRRAAMEDWTRWRDYRFDDEIKLWGYHIDFYMENGTQYWYDYDFERNGQWPFTFQNGTSDSWPQDAHCIYDVDCVPKEVIAYEKLKDPIVGPNELRKVAVILRNKTGMTVLADEAIDCIWHETWVNAPEPDDRTRDLNGLPAEAYNFTLPQMYAIEEKLREMIVKYEGERWTNNSLAAYLVENFEEYLVDVSTEIAHMEANPQPTPAPYANYERDIREWYQSLGKGNRYEKAKVQYTFIWKYVEHFYDATKDEDDGDNSTTSSPTIVSRRI